jgi:D-alanine transaminase
VIVSRVAYVNGRYLPLGEAVIGIEDRGYQFSDGVYEVVAVMGGRVTDWAPHMDRLDRSLKELRIRPPMSRDALKVVAREVARRNRVMNGMLYIQVTRGVARRDHPFPRNTLPSLVMTARSIDFSVVARRAEDGIKVATLPDIRWGRCDIKSVSLLPNVLAKQEARDRGAFEAWLVDTEGYVTEGASTNAWIVDPQGRLVTRPLNAHILPGVTRLTLMKLAETLGIPVIERPFSVEEAKKAREAFVTSTTAFLMPVVEIDGAVVANGAPGSVSRRLLDAYRAHMVEEAGLASQTEAASL